ncbi:hypothetical protein MNEG_14090 [Monoraphidium neglectum]|uniref:Uncharacterized protein n=1 Tax=Monoraphidium neglectum TaxID=145388 RepID=A0A0D2J1F3_9CHLO|nr:hypothetical protein MNEG_14090 [Monoraphidium neglectum]KIY93872.1 hypothetical protein MNEG_14090 [Monoraphidium neglectum]|eukprot:XP_013892892.1 hypothetical protein MNEG_14090 [Monoraphidium neglectum]
MDAQVRQLKLEHLKRRAADALRRGNFRDACDGYTEALRLCPPADRAARRALLANRSAALLGAGRAADALQDARGTAAAAPGWAKARWREGRALGALGRWPEACHAYARAWDLSGGDPECAAALRSAAARLTRPQLADSLLSLLLPGSFGGDGADDVSAGAAQTVGACGGGASAAAAAVVDSEGRRLEGDAAGLRREAVREAMFLEVKEEGPGE